MSSIYAGFPLINNFDMLWFQTILWR